MSPYFQSYPLGDPINGSPHSVCVSLPTMAEVIGYEERQPEILEAFSAGYPRFFRNPLIVELARLLEDEGCMHARDPLLPTEQAAEDLCRFVGINDHCVAPLADVWTARMHEHAPLQEKAQAFLRHTGCGLSSREAEGILERWFGIAGFEEDRRRESPESNLHHIREHLYAIYGTAAETDIRIFRSGMNAFYAGYRAIRDIQLARGRDIWIQLGWLYVDTARILEKFAPQGTAPVCVYDVVDPEALKDVLSDLGDRVAGIVTEVPTNPLVQTPDLPMLRDLADRHKAALILDPTLVSPHNVNVLPYADLHINSLTKYAAVEGDVMMGALALNAKSRFYDDLLHTVDDFGTVPSSGDLARMALEIDQYPATIRAINASTVRIAEFLENHPGVASVHWARSEPSGYNYNWLQHLEAGPGGIITFTLKKPLAAFHDRCRFVKSPSFGTRFTMMCPFMYLAHYDQVRTEEGRHFMRERGVDPDLIRFSVGLEPVEAIIEELDRCL